MSNYICRKYRRYEMGWKYFTPEQIIKHLREAEILLGKGNNVAQACKKIGVSEQTYYCWRREYGVMLVEKSWT
jgi:ACT domain-containing protein